MTVGERIEQHELRIRDEREAVIRKGYDHVPRVMSGLLAAVHSAFAGGGFHQEAVNAVLAEDEAARASVTTIEDGGP